MKIAYKKLAELKNSDYNPRALTKKQREDLTTSIKKFGFAEPIVINANAKRKNIIVGGHQRVEIARELGIKLIPCVAVNLKLKDERELNIRLNKNVGDWDYEKLLKEFEVMELLNFGFEKRDLDIDVGALVDKTKRKKLVRNEVRVQFQLGDLRFIIPVKEYTAWMNKLAKEAGMEKDKQIECIRERLKLD